MLKVVRLKPNPTGKDRNRNGVASPTQLAAEWADIQNMGSQRLDLSNVELYHWAFTGGTNGGEWQLVRRLSGTLAPGAVLRVHAGEHRTEAILLPEDRAGAQIHLFSGRDQYVWNNREGDTALLWYPPTKQKLDQASYDPNPPEGAVLTRTGDKLIPAGRSTSR